MVRMFPTSADTKKSNIIIIIVHVRIRCTCHSLYCRPMSMKNVWHWPSNSIYKHLIISLLLPKS